RPVAVFHFEAASIVTGWRAEPRPGEARAEGIFERCIEGTAYPLEVPRSGRETKTERSGHTGSTRSDRLSVSIPPFGRLRCVDHTHRYIHGRECTTYSCLPCQWEPMTRPNTNGASRKPAVWTRVP